MRRSIYVSLVVIFALIFLVSGGFLVKYYVESNTAAQNYNELAQIVDQAQQQQTEPAPVPSGSEADTEITKPQVQLVNVTDPETGKVVQVLPQYAQVFAMNTDMVGWIRIDGTRINYPVMQTPNHEDYYLYRDFYKNYSNDGSIYVREECNVFLPSDNVTIYGHRMNSGAMFADLMNYKEQSFWEDHRYIRFDTLRECHIYEVMAVFKIPGTANNGFQFHLFDDAQDPNAFVDFVDQCKSRALYETGVYASYGDKLITLCTCEKGNSYMRVVVVAKQIS